VLSCPTRRSSDLGSCLQRQRDPSPFAKRSLDRVDHFLDPRAVAEVTLVLGAAAQNLADEAAHEVRVEERTPRLMAVAARRVAARGDLQFAELHLVGRRRSQRFADTGLLDEAADERALAAVDARFDAGVVADR